MSLTTKAAGAFRKVRKYFPAGTRFFMLKRAGQTSQLTVVRDVTDEAWFVNYNKYREQEQFEMAIDDEDMANDSAQTSFMGFGVPDAAHKIDLDPIKDEARDKSAPVDVSPTWKFFGVREPSERFLIPDEFL